MQGQPQGVGTAQAEPFLGHIMGVGLDSCELGFPPGVFQEVFQKAKMLGLKRVAHAGASIGLAACAGLHYL